MTFDVNICSICVVDTGLALDTCFRDQVAEDLGLGGMRSDLEQICFTVVSIVR